MLSPLYGQLSPLRIPTKVAGLDPDALAYIAAVEAADGQALEEGVATAFTEFITGCKSDGIWDAIKASCILAGARTLSSALVPLVGTAPTNFNFVSGDYDRETGLKGNGSTKYLDSTRAANDDPQNSCHISYYQTYGVNRVECPIGSNSSANYKHIFIASGSAYARLTGGAYTSAAGITTSGLYGASRGSSSTINYKKPSTSVQSFTGNSVAPSSLNSFVFAQNTNGSAAFWSTRRLSFYSIGEDIDLSLLNTRVSTLMTDIAAAI